MKCSKKSIFYSLFFLIFSFFLEGKSVIIFDLGGVVFKEAEFFVYENLPKEIKEKIPESFRGQRIFLRAFDFVHHVTQTDYKKAWLMGTVSGNDIVEHIHKHIDKPEYANFFKSDQERLLIKHGAWMILAPEELAQWTLLIPEALQFITQCKEKNLRLAILSNWDPLSFPFLQKKFPELFSLFDTHDIFIPARCSAMKPDSAVYDYVLKTMNVKSTDCIFIDDSKANITSAQQCGIASILHTDWDSTINEIRKKI